MCTDIQERERERERERCLPYFFCGISITLHDCVRGCLDNQHGFVRELFHTSQVMIGDILQSGKSRSRVKEVNNLKGRVHHILLVLIDQRCWDSPRETSANSGRESLRPSIVGLSSLLS